MEKYNFNFLLIFAKLCGIIILLTNFIIHTSFNTFSFYPSDFQGHICSNSNIIFCNSLKYLQSTIKSKGVI